MPTEPDQASITLALYYLADYPALVSPEAVDRIARRVQDAAEDEMLRIQQDLDDKAAAAREAAMERR